ncbi:MAG: hypothetical protein PVI97_20250 [Candidatus Thiodiazotropha sp.]
MCITIPSSANIDRSRKIPLWHWLTQSPVRLLSAGGGVSLLPALWHSLSVSPMADGWQVFNLLFAILPFFLFALLLAYLPSRLKVTPLRYVGYGSLFFLMLACQLLFHLSILLGEAPGITYFVVNLIAWLWFIKVFGDFLRSSYVRDQKWSRGLFISLLWGIVVGAATGIALISGWLTMPIMALIAGLSYLLPASLFLLFSRYRD